MTNPLPQPCARWANLLAAHPDTLSPAERRALDAHVARCQACAAARADYQRMDTRIRSLPDPRIRPDLPPWLLALQAAQTRNAPAPSVMTPLHSTEKHMQTNKKPGISTPAPTPTSQGRPTRRRVVSWVTAVAALVVIVLIATALLVSHPGKPVSGGIPRNNTATPPSSQAWAPVAGLDHLSALPIIAPGNPKIIYLVGSQPLTLQRSDDSGGHWRNLPLPPSASQAYSAPLLINAADAHNIFLLLSFDAPSSVCPNNQGATGQIHTYSGYSCQLPYYSVDGGAHWGLVHCISCGQPVSGAGTVPFSEIITQGNHLYSLVDDQSQHQHLITSSDKGATWHFADTSLLAKGQGICGFGAVPTGSSVYALVQSGYCSQAVGYVNGAATHSQAPSGLTIWRSNDAGAHWSQAGAFPYQQADTANFRAIDTGGAQPTLLAAAGQAGTYQRLMSTDGGKTWQLLPTQGLPDTADIFAP
ncbi:MAG TPA: sialidase family protein, partial [Ktedonobacterales bacterium]